MELVSIWIVGGGGAVYDGRDGKRLAKWMEGVVGGMAIVERVAWFIKRVGRLAQGGCWDEGKIVGSVGEVGLR